MRFQQTIPPSPFFVSACQPFPHSESEIVPDTIISRNVQRNSGEIQSRPARHSASSVSTRSMEASIPRALSDESPTT